MKQYPLNSSSYFADFRKFVDGLAAFGSKPALNWFDREGRAYSKTYFELTGDVTCLRRAMFKRGLTGKRVVIAGENSYEWLLVFLAVTSSGGVAICLDTEQNDQTVCRLCEFADADVIFTDNSLRYIFQDQNAVDTSANLFLLERTDGASHTLCTDALLREGRKLPDEPCAIINPDQTAEIMFTSGTTSMPKAVELTHRNVMTNIGDAYATIDLRDSAYSCLPFFHAYGLNCGVLYMLLMGSRLTINGNLRFAMRDLYLSKSVTLIMVPLLLEVLYGTAMKRAEEAGKTHKVEKRQRRFAKFGRMSGLLGIKSRAELRRLCFGETKIIICGGAHLNPDISRNIEALGVMVVQGYGVTECSPLVAVGRNRFHDRDTVGVLLPSYEMKTDDGEILLRGPCVAKGYYKDPEASTAVKSSGWFRTGDIGGLNSNGMLTITGRLKNLIVLKNGKKVSPEMIEALLEGIPLVKEVRVYGAACGDTADDVRPAAAIYPDPEETAGLENFEILSMIQESIEKINDSLPSYQQVQLVTLRDQPFERTGTSKIKR